MNNNKVVVAIAVKTLCIFKAVEYTSRGIIEYTALTVTSVVYLVSTIVLYRECFVKSLKETKQANDTTGCFNRPNRAFGPKDRPITRKATNRQERRDDQRTEDTVCQIPGYLDYDPYFR
jgi:hypothetical protein